jgi:hypothetical protein
MVAGVYFLPFLWDPCITIIIVAIVVSCRMLHKKGLATCRLILKHHRNFRTVVNVVVVVVSSAVCSFICAGVHSIFMMIMVPYDGNAYRQIQNIHKSICLLYYWLLSLRMTSTSLIIVVVLRIVIGIAFVDHPNN